MKILLTGAQGQLGRHLLPVLSTVGRVVTTGRRGGDRPCDLTDLSALRALLNEFSPDVIVNPAAWTAVDDAEDHPDAADALNRALPEALAAWAREYGALLVHYSTDYVFDGQPGRPWSERDPTSPSSVYGRTKLEGEQAIVASGARALILRTAWLYSACPGNFLSAILRRAGQGSPLKVVSDQVGSPTWAGSLAEATANLLIRPAAVDGARVLHATDRGQMSWHEFANMAVDLGAELGVIDCRVPVEPIDSSQWPQKAYRPAWSVLDPSELEAAIGTVMPTTEESLSNCLKTWEQSPC
jgi:dTDP-4-dehydrorhamnose reductase